MILARYSAQGARPRVKPHDALEVAYDPAAPSHRAFRVGRLSEETRMEADEPVLRQWMRLEGIDDDRIDRAIASLTRGHLAGPCPGLTWEHPR